MQRMPDRLTCKQNIGGLIFVKRSPSRIDD